MANEDGTVEVKIEDGDQSLNKDGKGSRWLGPKRKFGPCKLVLCVLTYEFLLHDFLNDIS